MEPQRIQLRRTKGWRKPDGAIVVSRPSKWGNPFKVGEPYFVIDLVEYRRGKSLADAEWRGFTAKDAVECFERWFKNQVGASGFSMAEEARVELAGHDLACWCPLVDAKGDRAPCHADVLLRIANGTA